MRINPYDWSGEGPPPGEGDYLISNGGSVYEIVDVRPTSRPRRLVMICLKIAPGDLPPDAKVAQLKWYPRHRNRKKVQEVGHGDS